MTRWGTYQTRRGGCFGPSRYRPAEQAPPLTPARLAWRSRRPDRR